MKNDAVFGELVRRKNDNSTWYKDTEINFFGETTDISIVIDSDENTGEIEEGQYEAYKAFMDNWEAIQKSVLESILEYYKEERVGLGYDEEFDERYPEINTGDQLLRHIELASITVAYADRWKGRSIGLAFECTWDDEDGLGVQLLNETVKRVGPQGIIY